MIQHKRIKKKYVKGFGVKKIKKGHGVFDILKTIAQPIIDGVKFLGNNKDLVTGVTTLGKAAVDTKNLITQIRKKKIAIPVPIPTNNEMDDIIKRIRTLKMGSGFSYI